MDWPEWMNLPMEYWGDEELLNYIKSTKLRVFNEKPYERWPWVIPSERDISLHEFTCYLKHKGDDAELVVRLLKHWVNAYKSEWVHT